MKTKVQIRKEMDKSVDNINAFYRQIRAEEINIRYLMLDLHSVKIGMLVKSSNGDVYKVSGVSYFWGKRKPWLKGELRDLEGNYDGSVHTIYDGWKRIEP